MEKITEIKTRMNNGMKLIMEMDKLFERWKVIDDYDNYSVSTFGRVRNDDTGKILINKIDTKGYHYVTLSKNNIKKIRVFIDLSQVHL
jgi:guanylate kinase